MRPIDADSIVLDYSGLVYINPTDCKAIAEYFAKQIRAIPTILPERKRGRWIKCENRAGWYCSECVTDDYYAYFYNSDTDVYELQDKFCPNCGAEMRGE